MQLSRMLVDTAFVSNETAGGFARGITPALKHSKIQVLLATQTCSKKTNQTYSTYQEMNYSRIATRSS